MNLSKVSISVSLAYVLVVAVVTTIASLVSSGGGLFAAQLLTVPAGTLALGLLYYLVIPVVDAATGISGEGPLALAVLVFGYVLAAAVNVVVLLGFVALCREFREGEGRRRRRARTASTRGRSPNLQCARSGGSDCCRGWGRCAVSAFSARPGGQSR